MTKSQVLADIQSKIKTNGNQEITGDILQGVLTESVNIIPEKTSELTNDSSYQTETQVNAKVKVVSDRVDSLDSAQASQATDITNLQEGLSTANNSIQEVSGIASNASQVATTAKSTAEEASKTASSANTKVTSLQSGVDLANLDNTAYTFYSSSGDVDRVNAYFTSPVYENQVSLVVRQGIAFKDLYTGDNLDKNTSIDDQVCFMFSYEGSWFKLIYSDPDDTRGVEGEIMAIQPAYGTVNFKRDVVAETDEGTYSLKDTATQIGDIQTALTTILGNS